MAHPLTRRAMASLAVTDQPPRTGWLGVAERGSVLGIWFLVWLSTAFGRIPAWFVLRFIALYYVLLHASIRRTSSEYLTRVHGHASLAMVYSHVLCFAEVALDRAFIVSGKRKYFKVTCTGNHYFKELTAKGRGAILLGAHLGSFEAMRVQADREGLRINALGYFRNARMINAALQKLNPNANARVISIDHANFDFVLSIKERIERGEFIAILGDRTGSDGRMATVDFLGGQADFPTGAYVLASILKCPLYLTFGLYRRPDRSNLFFEPFEEETTLPRANPDRALHVYAHRFATSLAHFVPLPPDHC